jgi:hypothetical protein
MPSPESPANRMTTRSTWRTSLAPFALLFGDDPFPVGAADVAGVPVADDTSGVVSVI